MQSSHGQQGFRITKVWAKNFRSIADASVDLDELTVLVGPNASGKSNVLDVLRFIKDALRFDLEAAISMRHGIDAIHHQDSDDKSSNIELGIDAIVPGYSVEYGFMLRNEQNGNYRVKREYGKVWKSDTNGEPVEFEIRDGNLVSPEFMLSRYSRSRSILDDEDSDFDTTELALLRRISRMRLLYDYSGSDADERVTTNLAALTLWDLHRYLLNMRFYHIFPNTIREPQKLENARPLDEDAGNLASVLRQVKREHPNRFASLKDGIGHLIAGVSDLDVTRAGGYLVIRLKHDSVQGGTWFDLSQESDGTVRLLGILTALYQTRHLPLIGIEEPELTVHPGALAVLADMLNEASTRSQIIVTTHSPELIDCVTDYRHVENLRVVELSDGVTKVNKISSVQVNAVKKNLFSPGELHRMGELERINKADERQS